MDLGAWAKWLAEEKRLRPRTIDEYVKIARKALAAGDPCSEALRSDCSNQYREVAKAAAVRLVEWARPAALEAVRKRLRTLAHTRRDKQLPPEPIADEEWERLKRQVQLLHEPKRAILQILMSSGMRIGDAMGITRTSILAAQGGGGAIDVVIKGGRTIRLPYEPLRRPLERLLRRPDWSEAWETLRRKTTRRTKPQAEECLRRILRRAARDAGITRRMHPHLLRHTVAYRLIEKTHDIHLVSKLLGHSSLETTQLYTWYRGLSAMRTALEGQQAQPTPP